MSVMLFVQVMRCSDLTGCNTMVYRLRAPDTAVISMYPLISKELSADVSDRWKLLVLYSCYARCTIAMLRGTIQLLQGPVLLVVQPLATWVAVITTLSSWQNIRCSV